MLRAYYSIALTLIMAGTLQSRADAQPPAAYRMNVVVLFAEQRPFTPVFRAQLMANLRTVLQQKFSKLADVEVAADHPLAAEIQKKGLRLVLDNWNNVAPVTTGFVQVDFRNGRYRLLCRIHNGFTGQALPQIQTAATGDRRQITRLTAELIVRGFGLDGTIVNVEGNLIDVALRGAGGDSEISPWLKVGDVFAVCKIESAGPNRQGVRLPWGLLEVRSLPKDGVCKCRYYYRYQEEALADAAAGREYRCVQLPVTRAPLSLQLVDDKTNRPLDNVQVHVSSQGFSKNVQQLTTDNQGIIRTNEPLPGLAFVRVVTGTKTVAKMPVAVVGKRLVICRVNLNVQALSSANLRLRYHRWLRRIYEDLYVAGDRVGILNTKLSKSHQLALDYARRGAQAMKTELASLYREQYELSEAARKASIELDFSHGSRKMEELENRKQELQALIVRLSKVLSEERSEKRKRLRTLLEQAGLMEKQADYDRAIALYEKIIALAPGETKIAAHLKKLRSDWEPRNAIHKNVREFVYDVWDNKLDSTALKALLPRAREALMVCRKMNDRLTPKRMVQANLAHAVELQKRLESLRENRSDEDSRAELKSISELAGQLQRLHIDVRNWINNAEANKQE